MGGGGGVRGCANKKNVNPQNFPSSAFLCFSASSSTFRLKPNERASKSQELFSIYVRAREPLNSLPSGLAFLFLLLLDSLDVVVVVVVAAAVFHFFDTFCIFFFFFCDKCMNFFMRLVVVVFHHFSTNTRKKRHFE